MRPMLVFRLQVVESEQLVVRLVRSELSKELSKHLLGTRTERFDLESHSRPLQFKFQMAGVCNARTL